MPLIIVTGLPCSGKTHRAQQLLQEFESRIASQPTLSTPHLPHNVSVQYLTSSHASLDPPHPRAHDIKPSTHSSNPRDLIYNLAREEKTARAEEFSKAKRALSKNNIVILDAPNYIKGFRYQLWCEAKAVGTRSVVIHAAAREDECRLWNEEKLTAWGWDALLTEQAEVERAPTGAKIGKDVRGDLQPESHTAIFGDRLPDDILQPGLRSRSSSMGGDLSDEDDSITRRDKMETMTLKSLYISDRRPEMDENEVHPASGHGRASGNPEFSNGITRPSVGSTVLSVPSPQDSLPYSPATLQSLAMRYEPPSPFTRWDTPLFTVPPTDSHPPYQAVWDALFPPPARPAKKTFSQTTTDRGAEAKSEEVRRHAATVLPKATGPEALQTLESATADVVRTLLAAARGQGATNGESGSVAFSVPDPKTGTDIQLEVDVPLSTTLSQPALQRLRRKYTQIQRSGIAHGQGYVSGRAEIVKDFCNFLVTEWNAE